MRAALKEPLAILSKFAVGGHKSIKCLSGNPEFSAKVSHFRFGLSHRRLRFVFDQDRLRLIGLSPTEAAQQLQFLLSGVTVTQVRENIRAVDIVARSAGDERLDPTRLRDFSLTSRDGKLIPLDQIGRVEARMENPILKRRDRTPVLERLTRILRRAGMGTLLVNMLNEGDASDALVSASQRGVDAAVVIGTRFDDRILDAALGARRVKQLIVFARTSRNPNTVSIACDDEIAMTEIAEHLLARGCRRPLFVAGPDSQSAILNRKESFLAHWRRVTGYAPPAIHVGEYNTTSAIAGVEEALGSGSETPDALVCENDIIAIGAMDAVRYRLGRTIPRDIAITGFDDIPLARSPAYQLTTYRQPITEMANALVRMLEGSDKNSVRIRGVFVPRESA